MKNDINNVTIKFNCQQDWNAMTDCKSGKFCTGCNKTVFDFTDKKQDYFDAILSENKGKVCGKFTFSQMSAVQNFQKAAVIATSLLATEAFTQTDIPMPMPPKIENINNRDSIVMGEPAFIGIRIEESPEYEGGQIAFFNFIKENLRWPNREICCEGKVYVSFMTTTKGELIDFKIKRGLTSDFNEEAIRVLKLTSGKWKAGKLNGRAVTVAYTIPIKFKLE
jgi:Gram-negative bacterial TonB protein C-terminal